MRASIETPLLFSEPISRRQGKEIFLKLENLQPTGSFKDRGIGNLCNSLAKKGASHFVSSSGGNAGLAAAYAGKRLNIPTTVIALNAISQEAKFKIKSLGAEVIKAGETWDEIHSHALRLSDKKGYAYLHPFEHQMIWDGYSNIVKELCEQGPKPSCIVLSVGGGGLLSGVCQGLKKVGWEDVKVFAVETKGAASFHAATKSGHLVTLERITSIATTLGATRVTQKALDYFNSHPIESIVVEDVDAVNGCNSFSRDHRMLVEPSCGASLSLLYPKSHPILSDGPVVVIVCGGSGVSCESILKMSQDLSRS